MNTALVNIKDFFQKHKRNLTQPKLLNQSFQCFPQLQHDIALLRMWEHAWDHELRGRQVKKQIMSFTVIGHGLFDMNHDWELVWYSMTLWWRTWWTLLSNFLAQLSKTNFPGKVLTVLLHYCFIFTLQMVFLIASKGANGAPHEATCKVMMYVLTTWPDIVDILYSITFVFSQCSGNSKLHINLNRL